MYVLYVWEFYTMQYLRMFCLGGFVIYISCAWVILPLRLFYIFVFIHVYVNSIPVSALTILFISYYLLIIFTSYWWFFSIYLLCVGYSTTVRLWNMHLYSFFLWILYQCLQLYVCVYYVIYSLVVIHIGRYFCVYFWFIMLHISVQYNVYIVIGSRDSVYKHPCRLWFQPCRDLWKMQCRFPRVRYQCL